MDTQYRLYRFGALMDRLTSPAWSVIRQGRGFIFIPTAYYRMGRGHE